MDLERLRLQLGHEDLSTTVRYMQLVPEDVQRAHQKASSLARIGVKVR